MYMPILSNSLFNELWNDVERTAFKPAQGSQAVPSMRTDVKETKEAYNLEIELPGMKKENVSLKLKDGYLTVVAENKLENVADNKSDVCSDNADAASGAEKSNGNAGAATSITSTPRYIRRERFYGSCSRSFYVGEDLTQADIEARFENGILYVLVPKKAPKKMAEEDYLVPIAG